MLARRFKDFLKGAVRINKNEFFFAFIRLTFVAFFPSPRETSWDTTGPGQNRYASKKIQIYAWTRLQRTKVLKHHMLTFHLLPFVHFNFKQL